MGWKKSVAWHWAVRESGMTAVDVSRRVGITQSAVTKAVYRREKLANGKGFQDDAGCDKSGFMAAILYQKNGFIPVPYIFSVPNVFWSPLCRFPTAAIRAD